MDAGALAGLAGLSVRSSVLDRALRAVSTAANKSLLWCAIAAVLTATGGEQGRRAAARGLTAIGMASATVNGPLKLIGRRPRPTLAPVAGRRPFPVPASFSFPSGHTASAAAFATAAGAELPAGGAPLTALAAVVGYSRIHTGVHFPSDVLAGAAVGAAAGMLARRLWDGPQRRDARRDAPPTNPVGGGNGVPRRAVLLFSPQAGSARQLGRARAAMIEAGFSIVEEIPVAQHHRLARWVQDAAGPPLVVAAGGDGTVGAAASYVAHTAGVLAIVPLGTSNDFARSLLVPTNPVDAARLLVTGKISTVDAGWVTTPGRVTTPGQASRLFVHAATVGVNVDFARLATTVSLRARFGRFTYAVAAARALRERTPFRCELRYAGRTEHAELVHLSIVNAPVFGGVLGMRVAGGNVDDRALDVIAVEHLPLRRLLLAGSYHLSGLNRSVPGIRTFPVGSIQVHADGPLDFALDGEVVGPLPAEFTVAGEALRVLTSVEFVDIDTPATGIGRVAAGQLGSGLWAPLTRTGPHIRDARQPVVPAPPVVPAAGRRRDSGRDQAGGASPKTCRALPPSTAAAVASSGQRAATARALAEMLGTPGQSVPKRNRRTRRSQLCRA